MDQPEVKALLQGVAELQLSLYGEEITYSIWPVDELDEHNAGYELPEYLPEYYAIGTDGGLEMLVVHLPSGRVYSIPFVPMESESAELVAPSLMSLIHR